MSKPDYVAKDAEHEQAETTSSDLLLKTTMAPQSFIGRLRFGSVDKVGCPVCFSIVSVNC